MAHRGSYIPPEKQLLPSFNATVQCTVTPGTPQPDIVGDISLLKYREIEQFRESHHCGISLCFFIMSLK